MFSSKLCLGLYWWRRAGWAFKKQSDRKRAFVFFLIVEQGAKWVWRKNISFFQGSTFTPCTQFKFATTLSLNHLNKKKQRLWQLNGKQTEANLSLKLPHSCSKISNCLKIVWRFQIRNYLKIVQRFQICNCLNIFQRFQRSQTTGIISSGLSLNFVIKKR